MEKVNNLSRLVEIADTKTARDGTAKFLVKLNDGEYIECVLLNQDYGKTVCISSQVGCKMNCAFCQSGKSGFVRNLTADEMLAQVMVAKKYAPSGDPVSHIANMASRRASDGSAICQQDLRLVVMGIGEPFDNFQNLAEFLKKVDIGARKISVSTCGLPDGIRAFADLGLGVNLCISLHAPNDAVRAQIMPIAKRYSIAEIFLAAKYFFDRTHRRVIFEYALIDGVNCAVEHAQELAMRLKKGGFSYHVNLINLNAGGGDPQRVKDSAKLFPPNKATAKQFMDALIKSGVSCTMRVSRGNDIDGACGQLRARAKSLPTVLSISLDPSIDTPPDHPSRPTFENYLREVNTWDGVTVHLDIKPDPDAHGYEQKYLWAIKNSAHPVDVHVFQNTNYMREHHNCGVVIDIDQPIPWARVRDAQTVIVMSVKEGKSGQTFNAGSIEKIKKIRAKYPDVRIIADGGINAENIALVRAAGANVCVVGAFIYNMPSPKERAQTVSTLLDILRK